jgi:hypothetical protein
MRSRIASLCTCAAWLAAGIVLLAMSGGSASGAPARLVVLRDTGIVRDGLPVLERHPDEARVVQILSQGFSGRLLRLFELEQRYLQRTRGIAPEPAYLLLSNQVGGFPRFGFILDGDVKRSVGYVDIQAGQRLTGSFGTTDQIFPHELAHIIVTQLAGRRAPTGVNQIHAVGVRTDPETAFSEGFAEHMQVVALDDPEADPATRRAAIDPFFTERADRQLRAYARELSARWAPAGAMRGAFVLWFSGTESVLRYSSVKANRFDFEPAIPARLLEGPDPYAAYLVANVIPGESGGERKTRARALATEGVVSTLFWRWVTAPALQGRAEDDAVYRAFGTDPASIGPLDRAYLKLFWVFDRRKPGTAEEVIDGYKATFPAETEAVDRLVREVVGEDGRQPQPAIWLANRAFVVGTTLFDQWRRLPRPHTFDLNAASLVDLVAIPGMTRETAARVLAGAPYESLEAVRRVGGMTPGLMAQLSAMADEMARLRRPGGDEAEELSLRAILLPYLWRTVLWIIVAGACGALLRRRLDGVSWLRAIGCGMTAGGLTVLTAYVTVPASALMALLLPVAVFGVPCAFVRAVRAWRQSRGSARQALMSGARVLAGWTVAALPAVVLIGPLF